MSVFERLQTGQQPAETSGGIFSRLEEERQQRINQITMDRFTQYRQMHERDQQKLQERKEQAAQPDTVAPSVSNPIRLEDLKSASQIQPTGEIREPTAFEQAQSSMLAYRRDPTPENLARVESSPPLTEQQRAIMEQNIQQLEQHEAQRQKEIDDAFRYGIGDTMKPWAQDAVSGLGNIVLHGINTAALGIPDAIVRNVAGRGITDIAAEQNPTGATAGRIIGEMVGLGKAYQAVGNLGRSLSPLTRTGVQGAAAGALYGGAREAADLALDTYQDGDNTLGQRAANIAGEAALGAAGDVALTLIGRAARKIIEKYRNRGGSPTLALPIPRREARLAEAQKRSINEYGSEPIANEYTFALSEPSESTLRRVENIKEARNDLAEIENELRVLKSRYEKAINDQYEYLKQSLKNRGGVRQGYLLRNDEGEVIGRVGRISDNPEWYQEFYATYNKVPNRKELYELAKRHIDEGYIESGFRVPSWREQTGYDEAVRTLENVRDQIKASLRELDPAITFTDAKLVDEVVASARRLEPKTDPNKNVTRAPETPSRDTDIPRDTNTLEQIRSTPTEDSVPPQMSEIEKALQEATNPRIRDRVYDFFDQAEREARERIARRRNRLSANPVDEWADYAIIMASKVVKGTIRLADFTEELVKEFGESVRPHANKILKMTQQEIQKMTGRAAREVEDAVRFNSGGGDATTFRNKIDRNQKKKRRSFSEVMERARTHFIDDLAALERLEKRVLGGLASAEDSLYKTARLFKGAPSKAHQIIQDRLSPIARQVEQAGYTMEDLGDYALAMHARDVNARYMKSGFTDAEIKAVIDKYGTPELEAARQELLKINRDLLNELADAGVISRELVDTLNERWRNYMPLFRSFDDDVVAFESGLSNALANVSSPIKRLKGSERNVIDPIESMVKNIFRTVNAAERNRVALQLAKLANNPNAEGIIRRLDKAETVDRKNVVTVLENGERVRYEVEPNVYKALLNLDRESSNMIINILSKPASVLRAGATLTPEFSLRNPMRDIVQAYVTSNSGFNPLIDFPIGLIETIKGRRGNSQLYRQWINDLGDYGNIMSMDRKLHREALNKVLKQPVSRQFINILNGRALLSLLRTISDVTESATKLGEYRAALRSGASRQEAAYRSRDIMDFARAGSSIRQANKIIAFFNANIQGKSKILRALRENPVGVTTRAFTAITLPTVAAFVLQKYLANDTQRNTIEEAPDWMKDTFWLIPVPGTDVVARIPKPFDLAPIFANLPERALEYVYNEDKEAFDGFVRRSMGDLAIPIQITGLWPFIEGISNYSFFRDAPIIPRREEGLEYRDQYDPIRTSETARILARGAEFITGGEGMFRNFSSPRVMDNTIRGLTAGLGGYATDAIDAILRGTGLTDRPQAPAKRLEQLPLLKAFTVDPMQSSKTLDKFYSMKEKIDNARNSARINERPFDKEVHYQILNQHSRVISEINKQIRNIEASDLSPTEKRNQIEQLQKYRLEVARNALNVIEGLGK